MKLYKIHTCNELFKKAIKHALHTILSPISFNIKLVGSEQDAVCAEMQTPSTIAYEYNRTKILNVNHITEEETFMPSQIIQNVEHKLVFLLSAKPLV